MHTRLFSRLPLPSLFFLLFSLLLLNSPLPTLALTQNTHPRALQQHRGDHFARSPFAGLAARQGAAAAGVQKRQGEAPGAAVQVGNANPEVAAGQTNDFRVELPSRGSADGGISAFNKRQAGVQPKEELGTSNPAPAEADLNNRDDNTPVKSQQGAPAGMTDFKHRSRPVAKRSPSPAPKAFAHPVPRADQLNRFPHHLAARGKADGTIETF